MKKINLLLLLVFILLFSSTDFCYAATAQNLNDDNSLNPELVVGATTAAVAAISGAILASAANHHGAHGNFSPINCDLQCQHDLQQILDQARLQYDMPAMSMSISLSPTQAPLNFYSGYFAKNSNTPINAGSLFEVGSMTKSFVATVLLQLEAEGKLSLDDKLSKWLPEYTAWQDVTIRQLLNMTGGIFDYFNDDTENFLQILYQDPTHFWPMSDIVARSYQHNPNSNFSAGTNWHYSNVEYTLGGMIIEKVTNRSVEENLRERIFAPLDFKHTVYDNTLIPSNWSNVVHVYDENENAEGDLFYGQDVTDINLSVYNAAGALLSTSEDLVKWFRVLFNGNILPPQQFKEMTSLVCVSRDWDPDNTCTPGAPLPATTDQMGFSFGLIHAVNNIFGVYQPFGEVWFYGGDTIGNSVRVYYITNTNFIMAISGDVQNGYLFLDVLDKVYDYFYHTSIAKGVQKTAKIRSIRL